VGQLVHGGTVTRPIGAPEAGQHCHGVVGPPSPLFLCGSSRGWTTAIVGRWTGRVPP
jgi:hypothetical protein